MSKLPLQWKDGRSHAYNRAVEAWIGREGYYTVWNDEDVWCWMYVDESSSEGSECSSLESGCALANDHWMNRNVTLVQRVDWWLCTIKATCRFNRKSARLFISPSNLGRWNGGGPMTLDELVDFSLSRWPNEVRDKIIEDLSRDDPSHSIYGWSEHIPSVFVSIWPDLDMGQRLILYVVSEEADSCSPD